MQASVDHPVADKTERRYEHTVHRALLAQLIALASDAQATTAVRNIVRTRLAALSGRFDPEAATNSADREFLLEAIGDLDEVLHTSFAPSSPEQR